MLVLRAPARFFMPTLTARMPQYTPSSHDDGNSDIHIQVAFRRSLGCLCGPSWRLLSLIPARCQSARSLGSEPKPSCRAGYGTAPGMMRGLRHRPRETLRPPHPLRRRLGAGRPLSASGVGGGADQRCCALPSSRPRPSPPLREGPSPLLPAARLFDTCRPLSTASK